MLSVTLNHDVKAFDAYRSVVRPSYRVFSCHGSRKSWRPRMDDEHRRLRYDEVRAVSFNSLLSGASSRSATASGKLAHGRTHPRKCIP